LTDTASKFRNDAISVSCNTTQFHKNTEVHLYCHIKFHTLIANCSLFTATKLQCKQWIHVATTLLDLRSTAA